MEIVHAHQPFPDAVTRTLFLAGPTPRSAEVASWRPEALRLLAERGYDGTVFVPEPADGVMRHSYVDQVDWELSGLRRADAILFWVPRQLDTLPAFTTNVEFGMWLRSGRVVLGAPDDAPKLRYLRHLAEEAHVPQASTLAATVDAALALVGEGAARTLGECQVPAGIFRSPAFQQWYAAQRGAGNTLAGARVEWVFHAGPARHLFYFALRVDVLVTAEGRHKTNEIVLARPDIATVVLHRRGPTPRQSWVALIREFRSPVATADAYVRECPGGSSFDVTDDMTRVAVDEVREEVGLHLDASRLRPLGARQLMATMSSHRAHVFAAEITAPELAALRAAAGVVHGADDGERTTVEVWSVADLLASPVVDWSTLGMILTALDPGP